VIPVVVLWENIEVILSEHKLKTFGIRGIRAMSNSRPEITSES